MRFKNFIALTLVITLVGCSDIMTSFFQKNFKDSVASEEGTLVVEGLDAPATISRDQYGVPSIKAASTKDLMFATGWAMANDRAGQMFQFADIAEGRLAETAGKELLTTDMYLRSLNFQRIAIETYQQLSPEIKEYMTAFSNGVNKWLDHNKENLPFGLASKEKNLPCWTPEKSVEVYLLFNLGVGMNFGEEMMLLSAAQKVSVDKLAWLAPVYNDEPLRFNEAEKLKGINFKKIADPAKMGEVTRNLEKIGVLQGVAASNNWAVSPQKTKGGFSLLANDPHLGFTNPATWMMVRLESPDYKAIGATQAGIPLVSIGFNGHVGWGMTMVMGDSQDGFIEKFKKIDDKWHYLRTIAGQEHWLPVTERTEKFYYAKDKYVERQLRETDHGPVVSDFLNADSLLAPIIPDRIDNIPETYGVSLAWTIQHIDAPSVEAFLHLGQSETFEQAHAVAKTIRSIPVNLVFADAKNIGWQVTGRYPVRSKGTGLFPSPAWTGEYAWTGWEDPSNLPSVVNPASGFIATANQRTVEKDYPITLTESWFSPSRYERIADVLAASNDHDYNSMNNLTGDVYSKFHEHVKARWTEHKPDIDTAINQLPISKKEQAQKAFDMILAFDGQMSEKSSSAALWGVFQHTIVRDIFLDELGPDDYDPIWLSFTHGSTLSYSAMQDHMRGREGSPFWDNIKTDKVESQWDTIALALSDSWGQTIQRLGSDSAKWQWGDLLKYEWKSGPTNLQSHLGWFKRKMVDLIKPYLDRGPYPARGDSDTPDVAGVTLGNYDFGIHYLPSMRFIMDFSQTEPFNMIIAGSQSDNPSSPHYDDAISLYVNRENRGLPFNSPELVNQHFNKTLKLTTK